MTASSHWSFNDEKAIGINTFQFYWEVHQRLKYELSPEWLNICVPSQREHFECETSTVLTILSQNKWCLQPHKNILVISRRQKWLLVSHRDQIILLNMNLMPYKWSWGWEYGYSFVRNILWWSIFFVSHMMILWHRNDFHITGPLWGESTGDWWIPLTRTSNVEIRCICCLPEQAVEQNVDLCEGNPLVSSGFPSQGASNVEIWCIYCLPEQAVEQNVDFHVL